MVAGAAAPAGATAAARSFSAVASRLRDALALAVALSFDTAAFCAKTSLPKCMGDEVMRSQFKKGEGTAGPWGGAPFLPYAYAQHLHLSK